MAQNGPQNVTQYCHVCKSQTTSGRPVHTAACKDKNTRHQFKLLNAIFKFPRKTLAFRPRMIDY